MKRKRRLTSTTQLKRFITRHRRENGLTVVALARETGYTRPHIYNVANGQDPTREFMDLMLVACAKLIGRHVDREELFEFKPYRDKARKAS